MSCTKEEMREALVDALETGTTNIKTARDARGMWIATRYYGLLSNQKPEQLKKIAEDMGLSMTRTGQLRDMSVRKLFRHYRPTDAWTISVDKKYLVCDG
jgi:hypothetical protein